MLKHVREGIRLSGVDPRLLTVEPQRSGHVHIRAPKGLVSCSSSPSDPTIAAKSIAKELRKKS